MTFFMVSSRLLSQSLLIVALSEFGPETSDVVILCQESPQRPVETPGNTQRGCPGCPNGTGTVVESNRVC